jgi:hypothetical protein
VNRVFTAAYARVGKLTKIPDVHEQRESLLKNTRILAGVLYGVWSCLGLNEQDYRGRKKLYIQPFHKVGIKKSLVE